jgi:hypothetical protein
MTGTATALRETIRQMMDGKVSGPELMRQFMAHEEWLMPIHLKPDGEWHPTTIQDTEGQSYQLIFTDEQGYQAGLETLGQEMMGERTLTLGGCALFGKLGDDADVLSINWNSPGQIFFKKAQFPALRRWAQAINVERTLATPRPDLSMLKHFDSFYIVLQKVEGGYALTLAPDQHGRKLAAVFTAEDALDAFVKDQTAGQLNFEPVTRSISGELLFDDLKDIAIEGICFNASGPIPKRMFTAALAAAVMSAP